MKPKTTPLYVCGYCDDKVRKGMARPRDIFGTGDAAEKIISHIRDWLRGDYEILW